MPTQIPDTWLNVGFIIQRVKKGDPISIEVEGGFVRKPAPCVGLIIEDKNKNTMFVPIKEGSWRA